MPQTERWSACEAVAGCAQPVQGISIELRYERRKRPQVLVLEAAVAANAAKGANVLGLGYRRHSFRSR